LKKNKQNRHGIAWRVIIGLLSAIVILILAAIHVPVSSRTITTFVNKEIERKFKIHFYAEETTFYLLRQINMDNVDLICKGIRLGADRVSTDYNLFAYATSRNVPVHLRLENVSLGVNAADSDVMLGSFLQLLCHFADKKIEFDSIEVDFKYGPRGIELGSLSAGGNRFFIGAGGRYKPDEPVDYKIEIGLSTVLLEEVKYQLEGLFVPAELLPPDKATEVISIEIKGNYRKPEIRLNTNAGPAIKINI